LEGRGLLISKKEALKSEIANINAWQKNRPQTSPSDDFTGLLTGTNSSPIRNVRYFGPALYMLIVDLAENLRRRKLLQRTPCLRNSA
jgi:hypothetical protein